MGKTYSALKLATALQPGFDMDNTVFNIPDLLNKVYKEEVKAGEVVLFEEMGVAASNRESYMNKFNKAISFLLQTWRHRQIILIITVPDIAFIDAGTRKLFDATIECTKVVKSRRVVKAKFKFLQTNLQDGKIYYHNARTVNMETLIVEFGKPNIKLLRAYEKEKKKFTDALLIKTINGLTEKKESDNKREIRRCPKCDSLDTRHSTASKMMRCRQCGWNWKIRVVVPLSV